jgi:hypothetical protein
MFYFLSKNADGQEKKFIAEGIRISFLGLWSMKDNKPYLLDCSNIIVVSEILFLLFFSFFFFFYIVAVVQFILLTFRVCAVCLQIHLEPADTGQSRGTLSRARSRSENNWIWFPSLCNVLLCIQYNVLIIKIE